MMVGVGAKTMDGIDKRIRASASTLERVKLPNIKPAPLPEARDVDEFAT